MKTKALILLSGIMLSTGFSNAQADCPTELALFSQSAQVKDYNSALPNYNNLIEECADSNLAIYQYGERMFKHFLAEEGIKEDKKEEYAEALIENYKLRLENFPERTKKGETYANIAQAMYDNNIGDKGEQYQAFDEAWEEDKESFSSPKALYTYFSLLVDLQDNGDKDLQDVFEKYDELIAKIEKEEIKRAEQAEPLIKKQEENAELSTDEKRILKNSEIYLTNFSKIKEGIDGKLGQRADCDNLIPLYSKDFEDKKEDIEWLKIANIRLSAKDCTEDPLFNKVSAALHELEPSSKSAFSLGQLAEKNGDRAKAMEYYNEAADLEEDASAKARIYYRLAGNYKDRGNFSKARDYYKRALASQPSLGNAYLQIANMYASAANDCGDSVFNKRAVYWLAADYADRAGRVDPSVKKTAQETAASYRGRAPQKSDIFQQDDVQEGSTIRIGCWIGESVRVPSI